MGCVTFWTPCISLVKCGPISCNGGAWGGRRGIAPTHSHTHIPSYCLSHIHKLFCSLSQTHSHALYTSANTDCPSYSLSHIHKLSFTLLQIQSHALYTLAKSHHRTLLLPHSQSLLYTIKNTTPSILLQLPIQTLTFYYSRIHKLPCILSQKSLSVQSLKL
jgi:hypothetical protein